MYYVYIAKAHSGKIYVGISDNPERRIKEHNNGCGSAYTKSDTFSIVFLEQYDNLKEARRREIQIKKWRRDKKEIIIDRYEKGFETKRY